MEIELYGNKLKLENGEIYNYRKTKTKIYWCKITFTLGNNGYLKCYLTINKKQRGFLFHRLIYLFYNQEWDIFNTKLVIDHISRNKLDNRIENLRPLTIQENLFNTDAKGYSFNKGKWEARIMINRKSKYIGRYNTEEEAHEAYLEAKKKYHKI